MSSPQPSKIPPTNLTNGSPSSTIPKTEAMLIIRVFLKAKQSAIKMMLNSGCGLPNRLFLRLMSKMGTATTSTQAIEMALIATQAIV